MRKRPVLFALPVALLVFCPDLSLYDKFNAVYRGYFTRTSPGGRLSAPGRCCGAVILRCSASPSSSSSAAASANGTMQSKVGC